MASTPQANATDVAKCTPPGCRARSDFSDKNAVGGRKPSLRFLAVAIPQQRMVGGLRREPERITRRFLTEAIGRARARYSNHRFGSLSAGAMREAMPIRHLAGEIERQPSRC